MNVMAPHAPTASHTAMANAIRVLAMDAVEKAKSGHPGMKQLPTRSGRS